MMVYLMIANDHHETIIYIIKYLSSKNRTPYNSIVNFEKHPWWEVVPLRTRYTYESNNVNEEWTLKRDQREREKLKKNKTSEIKCSFIYSFLKEVVTS